jgi:acetoin utilization protein AcuB
MFNQTIISTPASPLSFSNTVDDALKLMDDLKVENWPVVEEGLFMGTLSEEILMDADYQTNLVTLKADMLPFAVGSEEHVVSALRLMAERRLDILPAITANNEYLGVITHADLLQQLSSLLGTHLPGGLLVLEVSPADFSPGEISRLIETNNAQMMQMNTSIDPVTGYYNMVIRINIIATLQRYDYRVTYFVGEEQYQNELRRNYHHLLHFIDM